MSTSTSGDVTPLGLAEMFSSIGRSIAAEAQTRDALTAVTTTAARIIPGARWVSISRGRERGFTTLAQNDPLALTVDEIQYELRTGPCIDAVAKNSVFHSADLATETRWHPFGPRAAALGARAVLSIRLTDQTDTELNLGLTIYSDTVGAFADDSVLLLATLLAAHTEPAVKAVFYRDEAAHLREALESNREIGVAMGILMTQHKLTRDQAFDLLRIVSQNSNCKLKDIASQVADTGVLDLPPLRRVLRPGRRPS